MTSPFDQAQRTVPTVAAIRLLEAAARSALLTALVAAVYVQTGSGAYVAALPLALYGLSMLLSPASGTAIDRFGPVRVMLGSLALEIPVIVALSAISSPLALCALAAVAFAAEAPFNSASVAYVADETGGDEDALEDSLGRVLVVHTIGIVIGPLLGGAGMQFLGLSTTLLVLAGVLGIAGVLTLTLHRATHTPEEDEDASLEGFFEGFRFISAHPALRGLAVALAAAWLAMGLVVPAEVAVADALSSAGLGYGLLLALTSVGSLVGSWHGTHFKPARERKGLALSLVALGAAFIAIGVFDRWWVVLALVPFVGYAEGVVEAVSQIAVSRDAPEAVRGRALAAMEGITMGGLVSSLVFAGVLLDALDYVTVFVMAGAVALLATLPLRGPRAQTQRLDDDAVVASDHG